MLHLITVLAVVLKFFESLFSCFCSGNEGYHCFCWLRITAVSNLKHFSNVHGFWLKMTVVLPIYMYLQVCKYFLEAVEKKQYGWFWVCPNGGKDCHYRHALPPGYVLKSQMKALLEEEAEKITIEEEIENQVMKFSETKLPSF